MTEPNEPARHFAPPYPPAPAHPRAAVESLTAEVVRVEGNAQEALETARNRLVFSGIVFLIAFAVIAVRVVDLGVFDRGSEPRVAETTSTPQLATHRAEIVDRNGIVLATTMPTYSLSARPYQVRDPAEGARLLAAILHDKSESSLLAKLSSAKDYVYIKRNLSPQEHYEVNRLGLPGLNFEREDHRFYPQGALTSHLVGFTNIDNQGLAGIELSFDDRLRGVTDPLALSIDLRLQHIMTEELASSMATFRAIGGAGVILDAKTHEVLAMVSLPNFDPRRPGKAPADTRFNRASLGIYEMGSVFKIFTTAMALDRGVVGLQDGYDTSNPIRVARYTIRDYKPKNRWMSVPEIFIHSSNIGTVHMAMDAGTQAQQAFLESLGLLERPALELSEVGQPQAPSPWREINTMTISYGHGVAVSPVQLASAVSAIVNGGTYRAATLLKRGEDSIGEKGPLVDRRVISAETSDIMRRLMRLVVTHGTGRKANVEQFMVGGKTGTSDKYGKRKARIASFAGAFPMNDPRYVVFAMIDEPKGTKETFGYATAGWVAAPLVGRLVERMAPIVGLEPQSNQIEEDSRNQLLLETAARGKGQDLASR